MVMVETCGLRRPIVGLGHQWRLFALRKVWNRILGMTRLGAVFLDQEGRTGWKHRRELLLLLQIKPQRLDDLIERVRIHPVLLPSTEIVPFKRTVNDTWSADCGPTPSWMPSTGHTATTPRSERHQNPITIRQTPGELNAAVDPHQN